MRQSPATSQALDMIRFYTDDMCRNISAGKAQRWDVLKWCVTVNLALATTCAVLIRSPSEPTVYVVFSLSIFSAFVSLTARRLLLYYSERMTRERNQLARLNQFVIEHVVNISRIAEADYAKIKSNRYDEPEVAILLWFIATSAWLTVGMLVASIVVLGEPAAQITGMDVFP